MNILIIAYYKKVESTTLPINNIQKRIFITGYLGTFCLSTLYFLVLHTAQHYGLQVDIPHNMRTSDTFKIVTFMIYISLLQYTFVYMIQYLTLSQYEKNQIELELLKLKSTNSDTVNQLLKQQIQPHFLFNALNTLKSLIKKRPDTAEEYLIRLSDFLRASFANNTSGLSTIADEVKICKNYMEMQKVRFGNAIQFEIDQDSMEEYYSKKVPVFSLQPLLENAIKHNIATNEQPLLMSIQREGDYIKVVNTLQYKKTFENSTGSGLANLKERYKIISGDEVIIQVDNGTFMVKIKILDR